MKLSIGIVGCGAIGQEVLRAVDHGRLPIQVAGVTSRTESTAREFLDTLRTPVEYVDLPTLVERSDLLVEAAGGHMVPDLVRRAFDAGKDLVVVSIGALVEHPELLERARATGHRLYLPSGAIAGLDGLKAACEGLVDSVTMVNRKPPEALEGAPYLVEHGISLEGLTREREVFFGTAAEAARGFPANLNVAAAVSFAGVGPERTMVRMLATPGLTRNCHDVTVTGEFGRMEISLDTTPSPNPKTSKLAALSVIRLLADLTDPVHIGT